MQASHSRAFWTNFLLGAQSFYFLSVIEELDTGYRSVGAVYLRLTTISYNLATLLPGLVDDVGDHLGNSWLCNKWFFSAQKKIPLDPLAEYYNLE